jgi:hypothetical protein
MVTLRREKVAAADRRSSHHDANAKSDIPDGRLERSAGDRPFSIVARRRSDGQCEHNEKRTRGDSGGR